jgi:hypothetical protein
MGTFYERVAQFLGRDPRLVDGDVSERGGDCPCVWMQLGPPPALKPGETADQLIRAMADGLTWFAVKCCSEDIPIPAELKEPVAIAFIINRQSHDQPLTKPKQERSAA